MGMELMTLSFRRFIKTVELKINALKLVEIARRVGREYTGQQLPLYHRLLLLIA